MRKPKYKPEVSRADLMAKAKEYLDELDLWGGLEVVLVPAPDPNFTGHMIRACQSQNPPWYQKFVGQYKSIRGTGRKQYKRPRVNINKGPVVRCLRRLAAGVFTEGRSIEGRLIDFMTIEIANEKYRDHVSKNPDAEADSAFIEPDGIPF